MKKDWTGDRNSIYKTLGANSHAKYGREQHDFYATHPSAAEMLLKIEKLNHKIWECSCGQGHLSKVFEAAGHKVLSTDLVDRGYGESGIDFLRCTDLWNGDIVTNPPYKFAQKFIEHGFSLLTSGNKLVFFLKVQFLEGKARKKLFEKYPPKTIHVSSSRILCGRNANFENTGSSAVAYAWFVWEKGWKGDTILKWFN
jgi:hypothetical protein